MFGKIFIAILSISLASCDSNELAFEGTQEFSISEITPTSATYGAELKITGVGFSQDATVFVAEKQITDIVIESDKVIKIKIPKEM